jgi:hypothetical protein
LNHCTVATVLEYALLGGLAIPREAEGGLQDGLEYKRWTQLADETQLLVPAGGLPSVGHTRWANHPLASSVVPLLASHAASERAREDLVALLLVGVDVLGYGETGRKDVLEAQQLAVGLVVVWRKVIRSPVAGFSMRSPALAMGRSLAS